MSAKDFKSLLLERWNAQVERCGFVLGDGSIVEVPNTHPQPELGFKMEPPYPEDVAATWHTHPRSTANLSMIDYGLFLSQPQWFHYIVSSDKVRCYCVEGGKVMLHED